MAKAITTVVDDRYGTIFVPNSNQPPSDNQSGVSEKYAHTFLRRVLHENETIHEVGHSIDLHHLESDVSFIEIDGGDVLLNIDVNEDLNRAWKLVLIALDDTYIVIPAQCYVSDQKYATESRIFIRRGEAQIMTVTCSRDKSVTKYAVEYDGTVKELIESITLAKGGDKYTVDEYGNLYLPIDEILAALRSELDAKFTKIDNEFINVYNQIELVKNAVLEWEE